jgi:hypothetical protein
MTALVNMELGGTRIEDAVLARLLRLEVRESDREPTMAIARFSMAMEASGEMFPLDSDQFTPAAKLSIDIAPPGGRTTRLLEGYVTHLRPHFEPIEANSYLDVVAMDAGALMAIGDQAAAYPDMTDAQAVEQIFERYGVEKAVTPTNAQHAADGQLLVQRDSDWAFVQRLARRNGFRCYLEHDPDRGAVVAHFGPIDTSSPQPDLTILRDGSNLNWLDVQHQVALPVRATASAIDPIRKRLIQGSGATSREPMGGDSVLPTIDQGLAAAGATARERWLRDPVPLDASIDAESTAASDELELCLEARGELASEQYRGLLRARRGVLIKGVGRRLAGTWYVSAVRTVLEGGSLTQTFVAVRNAIAPAGSEKFGTSADEETT